MEQLKERLNKIIPRITSADFLNSTSLSNEIAFYIFDYPPEKELEIREHIKFILGHLKKKKPELRIKHINLFELIINNLKDNDFLDRAIKLQKEKGNESLLKALKGLLNGKKVAEIFVREADPDNHDLVLISGMGSVWPLLRGHSLLNNLHPLMADTPLVMFYPGVYSGLDLRLFGRLDQKNYYRAFRLVP